MKCEICGRDFKNITALSTHIALKHKDKISLKDYYDNYLKKDINEGKCLQCGKEPSFISLGQGYYDFCSCECRANNKEIQKNVRETCLKNLGYDNASKSPKIKELKIETSRKKYGVEHPSQTKEFQEKRRLKCQKIYGTNHPMQNEKVSEKMMNTIRENNKKDINRIKKIYEKSKKTNLEKRGIDNIFRDNSYIKECTLKKLGEDHPMKCKEFIDKMIHTKIKNGTIMSDNQLSNFQIYCRGVLHFTNISLQKKFTKEELKKRKRTGVEGGLHVDHRFTVSEGFKQNILPCIIGCQSNLELLTWEINLEKGSKCSITKEELFKLYKQEI